MSSTLPCFLTLVLIRLIDKVGKTTRMPGNELLLVTTTVSSPIDAERIAKIVVEKRLAACVQIESIQSVYRWNGAVQCESEHRIQFKTTREACQDLEATILEHHPYEVPAVFAVPVVMASDTYAAWVCESIKTD